jgi:hypothetical protein
MITSTPFLRSNFLFCLSAAHAGVRSRISKSGEIVLQNYREKRSNDLQSSDTKYHNVDKPQPNKKSTGDKKIFWQDNGGKMIQKLLNHLATIILPNQVIDVFRLNRIFHTILSF